jgi:hypothetical protein
VVRRFLLILSILACSGCVTAQMLAPPPGWGDLAGKRVEDGVYLARAKRGPVEAVVQVEIKRGRLHRVRVIKHRCGVCGAAEVTIPRRIVDRQSTRVDAVTGATISSLTIMEAVQRAVDQARRAWLKKHRPGQTAPPAPKAPPKPRPAQGRPPA